jgi:hypothetical protein
MKKNEQNNSDAPTSFDRETDLEVKGPPSIRISWNPPQAALDPTSGIDRLQKIAYQLIDALTLLAEMNGPDTAFGFEFEESPAVTDPKDPACNLSFTIVQERLRDDREGVANLLSAVLAVTIFPPEDAVPPSAIEKKVA